MTEGIGNSISPSAAMTSLVVLKAKYEVGNLVGQGSYSQVFHATVRGSDSTVAIKSVQNALENTSDAKSACPCCQSELRACAHAAAFQGPCASWRF